MPDESKNSREWRVEGPTASYYALCRAQRASIARANPLLLKIAVAVLIAIGVGVLFLYFSSWLLFPIVFFPFFFSWNARVTSGKNEFKMAIRLGGGREAEFSVSLPDRGNQDPFEIKPIWNKTGDEISLTVRNTGSVDRIRLLLKEPTSGVVQILACEYRWRNLRFINEPSAAGSSVKHIIDSGLN